MRFLKVKNGYRGFLKVPSWLTGSKYYHVSNPMTIYLLGLI